MIIYDSPIGFSTARRRPPAASRAKANAPRRPAAARASQCHGGDCPSATCGQPESSAAGTMAPLLPLLLLSSVSYSAATAKPNFVVLFVDVSCGLADRPSSATPRGQPACC